MCEITVLMSVYNGKEELLEKAVNSILNQTLADFKFIIINDGSTKKEIIGILENHQHLDKRIILVNQENMGLTKSLNKGIQLSNTTCIARQDADDWSHPQRLEKQMEYLTQNPTCCLLGCNYISCNEKGEVLGKAFKNYSRQNIRNELKHENIFCHGSVVYKREAVLQLGGYTEELEAGQDYDLFIRMCERFPAAVLDEPLYYYRRSAATVSGKNMRKQSESRWITHYLRKQRERGEPANIASALQKVTAPAVQAKIQLEADLNLASYLLSAAEFRKSFQQIVIAWRRAPLSLFVYKRAIRWAAKTAWMLLKGRK